MTTSIISEAQKVMEWTNGQSELESRCSVIITKKRKGICIVIEIFNRKSTFPPKHYGLIDWRTK